MISVRAYDKAHKLNRVRKTRTFQQMSASDMVRKIAGEDGLAPKVEATNVVYRVLPAEQRDRLGLRLAARADARLRGRRRATRSSSSGRPTRRPAPRSSLRWQDNLLSFRPRMSGVQQVQTVNVRAWDPKAKRTSTGSAGKRRRRRRSPACSAARSRTTSAAVRPWSPTGSPRTTARRTRSRRARCNRTADSFYEADGVAFGDPKIKAGTKVKIKGVGTEVRRRVHGHVVDAQLPRRDRLPDAASRSRAAPRGRCSS